MMHGHLVIAPEGKHILFRHFSGSWRFLRGCLISSLVLYLGARCKLMLQKSVIHYLANHWTLDFPPPLRREP